MKSIYYLFMAAFLAPGLIYAQPANDNCSGALPIEVDGAAVTADNTDATAYGPQGSCLSGDQSDGNVWFSITLTEASMLSITTEEGTSNDSQLTLFTIDDCGGPDEAFTEIDCSEDVSFVVYMSEILTDELQPGTYFLSASTFSNEAQGFTNVGTYSISVSSATPPENDSCEGAIELTLDGPTVTTDNSLATIVGPKGSCYGTEQVAGDTWYMFTLSEAQNVRVLTEEGTSEDSQVSVYTIEGCGTGDEVYTEVGCNDDASDDNFMSIVEMENLPAGVYYIKAGTYSSFFTGTYTISIESYTTVGVNDADKNANFSVYPNPSNGNFSILNAGVSGNYTVEIIDLTGRAIHTQTSPMNVNSVTSISVNSIASGVYTLRMVNNKDNRFSTERIVVN